MALLVLPKINASRRPPLGSVVNWSHPSTRNLRHFLVLNEGAGAYVTDLAAAPSLGRLSVGTQLPTWTANHGLRWAGTWTGTNAESIRIPAQIGTSITTAQTLEALVKIPANTSGLIVGLLGSDIATASAQGIGIGVGSTTMDNTGSNLIGLNDQVAWHATGVAIPNLNDRFTQVALVYVPGGTSVFYIGGRRVATASFASLAATTGSVITLYVGGYVSFSKPGGRVLGAGSIGLVRHWNRIVSDTEMARLAEEPFSMVAPPSILRSRAIDVGTSSLAWHTSVIKVWQ